MPKFIKLYNYPVQTVCIHINCMSPCDTCKQFVVFFVAPFWWLSMATTLFDPFWRRKTACRGCRGQCAFGFWLWCLTLPMPEPQLSLHVFKHFMTVLNISTMADGTFWRHVEEIDTGNWKWTETDSGWCFARRLRTSLSLDWLEHCKCGTRFGPDFHEQPATWLKS